jgi:hypothetical protein
MEEKRREIRNGCGGLYLPKLREREDGQPSRMIEGYAIVFGVQSELLADYWDYYREIIEPGAISEKELKTMDIKMTIWHNRERLLARSNKGEGTLTITVDEKGVKYAFEAPNTPDGDTALELVKRGDLAGSSFTYWTDENKNVWYEKTEDNILLRHVGKIQEVVEMTIASDPAFSQTSVTAREVEAHGVQLHDEPSGTQKKVAENRFSLDREERERNLNRMF